MSKTIYEKASDTAKKVRQVLKQEFPGIKFSVKSHSYSMGSSVYVSWVDGPTRDMVDSRIRFFNTKHFDGMTDSSSYSTYEWEGKQYSGADYIICQREFSHEYRKLIEDYGKSMFGDNWKDIPYYFNEAEAELNGNFPYNRMNEKTNRRGAR